jgi:hypothetical protein
MCEHIESLFDYRHANSNMRHLPDKFRFIEKNPLLSNKNEHIVRYHLEVDQSTSERVLFVTVVNEQSFDTIVVYRRQPDR